MKHKRKCYEFCTWVILQLLTYTDKNETTAIS